MITVNPGVSIRFDPIVAEVPILVDVSRSGREYPCDFRSPASFTDVHDNASMYVEELWGAAPSVGATMLFACFPNTYIDVNRGALDIDENLIEGAWPVPLQPTAITRRGLGLLKTVTRYGEPMHERKLTVAEVQSRMRRYYEPYHAEMAAIIARLYGRFGAVWQLSCHCMSAVGAPTHVDPGQPRTDICLGDLDGTTASPAFMDFLRKTFEGVGFSVSVNRPYKGGELTRRHGDPARGIHSVLIEINKKLFMDVKTFKKTDGFSRVHGNLTRVAQSVAEYVKSEAAAV